MGDDCGCRADPERADHKFQMADGSYPIDGCTGQNSVASAAKLAHHSNTYSFDQVKAHVLKAKRALGCPDSVIPASWSSGGSQMNSKRDPDGMCERAVNFQMASKSDGLTLEGYAAVFNSPTQIRDWEGDFEEQIAPGAFQRTLGERMPVLMFEHGRHPLIGSMPLGVIERAEEDSKGLFISARLTDNWLIQPVRDAVRDGAVTGMSFRFTVPEGGDKWNPNNTHRTIHELSARELGPVVFPAYAPTTAQIRSALDCIDFDTGRPGARSAGGGGSSDAQPGNGEASRIRAALRVLDVHPLQSKEFYRA